MSGPPNCDPDVFTNGIIVAVADTGSTGGNVAFEAWVVRLRERAGCPVDWCYFGGRAVLLTTGNPLEVWGHAKAEGLPLDPHGDPMRWLGRSWRHL